MNGLAYYSSLTLFLGAVVTNVLAERNGQLPLRLKKYAVRLKKEFVGVHGEKPVP